MLILLIMLVLVPGSAWGLKPQSYPGLSEISYHSLSINSLKSSPQQLSLPINQAVFDIPTTAKKTPQNISFETQNDYGYLNVTLGQNSIFGDWHHQGKHYRLTTEASGMWLIELPKEHLRTDRCGTNHANSITPFNTQPNTKSASNTLDVLIIHDRALALRYPGTLMTDRMDHYAHVANQTFANSGLDLAVRIVGIDEVSYNLNNTNSEMLGHIQSTLSGIETISGLQNLPQLRAELGADLVIAIRPHDIETRGNCGLAYYPAAEQGFDSSYGINMVSDGMSSWSLCSDQVFVHEIGHNLGAAHQYGQGGGSFLSQGSAFVKLYQFNTVMGSFGTGQDNRSKRLPMFSNPSLTCGGYACGTATGDEPSNNTFVIQSVIPIVSAYQPSISSAPQPESYQRSQRDFDDDGVIDWEDAFPFDATEQQDSDGDGVGDNKDAFPNNPNEQFDHDSDGVGNNTDNDDDNDLVSDENDAFPYDQSEYADRDFDGVGDHTDAFPDDVSEQQDYDGDGIGDFSDQDDDNDGYTDVSQAYDLLVVNTGDNRILRFDAQTGRSLGMEVLPSDGLITFQTDLSYDKDRHLLYYTSSSGVKRKNMMQRNGSRMLIPPYAEPPFHSDQTVLGTGFPTAIFKRHSAELVVSIFDQGKLSLFDDQNPLKIIHTGDIQVTVDEDLIESLIDIEYSDDYLLLGLNGRLYRGDFEGGFTSISQPGNPGLKEALDMQILADDSILISDYQRKQLLKYDASGHFQSIFVDLRLLNLGNPTGMTLIDEHLYVATQNDDKIHKFDSVTGAYTGVLIDGQGLNQPHKLLAIPSLQDRFHHDEAKVMQPNAGQWYASETIGRGFDIEIVGNRLNIIWYTFDDHGLPTWYGSSGDLNGFQYQSILLKTTQINIDSVVITEVGTLHINFLNERQAQVFWSINNVNGEELIQWHPFNGDPEINNYTGLWGRPDGPGWGISLATVGETSVAIAFLYDNNGIPRWIASEPVIGASPLHFNMLYVTSDTLCPGCGDVSGFDITTTGFMDMNFSASGDWDSMINWPAPLSGSWQLNDVPLMRFSSEPVRPR